MLKKYFYKTALTTAALSTAVSVLLAGCGQSAGTGTAKTNTVTSAVSGLNMTAFLTEKSIDHIFYETEGGHDGDVWQKGMYNFMKRLFYGSAFH